MRADMQKNAGGAAHHPANSVPRARRRLRSLLRRLAVLTLGGVSVGVLVWVVVQVGVADGNTTSYQAEVATAAGGQPRILGSSEPVSLTALPSFAHAGISSTIGGFVCDLTYFLNIPLCAEPLPPVVPATDPTPPMVLGEATTTATTTITNIYNQYFTTTNPTTIVREVIQETVREGGGSSSSLDTSDFATDAQLAGQADVLVDVTNNHFQSIAEEFTTASLTVTGTATFAGSFTSSVLASAPYFSATDAGATSTFLGALSIGTTSSSAELTLDGAALLAEITAPAATDDRLYNVAGDLYWAGSVIGGATTGQWTTDGTDVWREGGNVGVGTTTPASQLTLDNYTVTDDGGTLTGGNPQFQIHGTLDTTQGASGHVSGAQWYWDTVGANSVNVNGLRAQLNAGYTGTGLVRVADFQNLVAGNSRLNVGDVGGTIGATIESQGLSTGDNVGVYAIANGASNYNVALMGRSFDTTSAGTNLFNVGVLGVAGHYNGSNAQVGGWFVAGTSGLFWSGDTPINASTSAVILADSNVSGVPIFLGRANGAQAFSITNSGGIVSTSTTNATDFWKVKNNAGLPLLDLDSTNMRIGIGTSTPASTLHVVNPSGTALMGLESTSGNVRFDLKTADGNYFALQRSTGANDLRIQYNGSTKFTFQGSGHFGIGTAAPTGANLVVATNGADPTVNTANFNGLSISSVIDNAGNFGIGSSTPSRTLSVTGTVGFDGLGSSGGTQTLCLTDNKEVVTSNGACTASSEELKHGISTLSLSGVDVVAALEPSAFTYNNANRETWGFIAEDLAATDAHFIGYFDQEGRPRTIDTTAVLAAVVKAVQELIVEVRGFADRVVTRELCVEDVCVTRDQFLQIVERSGQTPIPPSPSVDDTSDINDEATEAHATSTTPNGDSDPTDVIEIDETATEVTAGPSEDSTTEGAPLDSLDDVSGEPDATVEQPDGPPGQ